MSKKRDDKLLTEVETELMTLLWKMGEGSVSQVLEKLPEARDLAYTSVSTILRILEQKKVLKTRREGRGHIYIPVLSKKDYEARTVRHVVEKVFDGTPVSLVRQLLDNNTLSKDELKELKKLIADAGEES